jgi:hypothetical protein
MRIPMVPNYSALPGGAFGAARMANAQAAFAPMHAYANALLPMNQAQYMPLQIKAQLMSNPMLWMASAGHPGVMTTMINSINKEIPQIGNPNVMNQMGGGGLLGAIVNHLHNLFGANKTGNTTQGASSTVGTPFDVSHLAPTQLVQVRMPNGSVQNMTVQQAQAIHAY